MFDSEYGETMLLRTSINIYQQLKKNLQCNALVYMVQKKANYKVDATIRVY